MNTEHLEPASDPGPAGWITRSRWPTTLQGWCELAAMGAAGLAVLYALFCFLVVVGQLVGPLFSESR